MFVIYKYDGLLNVINLLLTENGIELFQFIYKMGCNRTTEKSVYRSSAFQYIHKTPSKFRNKPSIRWEYELLTNNILLRVRVTACIWLRNIDLFVKRRQDIQ